MSLLTANLPSLALLGAVLVVGSTSGAVGGAMISSDDIADGAVTSDDVRNDTLGVGDLSPVARAALRGPHGPRGDRGPRGHAGRDGADGRDGVSGLEWSWQFVSVPAHSAAEVQAQCPDGKKATGGTAWWGTSPDPVQLFIPPSLDSGTAYSVGVPVADTLNIRLICASVA
jgi:hypothetical protein